MNLSRELRVTINQNYGAGNVAVDMRDGSIRLLLKDIGSEITQSDAEAMAAVPSSGPRLELS